MRREVTSLAQSGTLVVFSALFSSLIITDQKDSVRIVKFRYTTAHRSASNNYICIEGSTMPNGAFREVFLYGAGFKVNDIVMPAKVTSYSTSIKVFSLTSQP